MGFNKSTAGNNNLPTFNLRMSTVLGGLYVTSEVAEGILAEAKTMVGGDEVWKKGFDGLGANSVSKKVRDFVASQKEFHFVDAGVTGKLFYVAVRDVQVKGEKIPYLVIGLGDDEGKYFISLSLTGGAAQMLVRKLMGVKAGDVINVNAFLTYDKSTSSEQFYSNEGARLSIDKQEVKGVSPRDELQPLVQSAIEKLKDAGVDDKKTLRAREQKVTLDYHLGLAKEIVKRVAEKAPASEKAHESEPS